MRDCFLRWRREWQEQKPSAGTVPGQSCEALCFSCFSHHQMI